MKKIIYIILLIIHISCSDKQETYRGATVVYHDDFEVEKLVSKVENFDGYIDRARGLCVIDTLLLFYSNSTEEVLKVHSTKTLKKLGTLVYKGRALNELTMIGGLNYSPERKVFWCWDAQTTKVMFYDVDILHKIKDGNAPLPQKTINLSSVGSISNLYPATNNSYQVIYDMAPYKRIVNENEKGNIISDMGEYPIYDGMPDADNFLKSSIYQGGSCWNEELGLIATVADISDILTIYDINDGSIKKLVYGPYHNLPEFETREIYGSNGLKRAYMVDDKTFANYLKVFNVDNQIWVLSSPRAISQDSYPTQSFIYTYDWNGKPIKKYELDRVIVGRVITIDSKQRKIYATNLADEIAQLFSFNY